jgi:hypothetical protein
MKIRTQDLTGAALDWAVASYADKHVTIGDIVWGNYAPSTDWAQGGPIIEREGIQLHVNELHTEWMATCWGWPEQAYATTPLIAAMRCYVASKLGDEVDIPEELI